MVVLPDEKLCSNYIVDRSGITMPLPLIRKHIVSEKSRSQSCATGKQTIIDNKEKTRKVLAEILCWAWESVLLNMWVYRAGTTSQRSTFTIQIRHRESMICFLGTGMVFCCIEPMMSSNPGMGRKNNLVATELKFCTLGSIRYWGLWYWFSSFSFAQL